MKVAAPDSADAEVVSLAMCVAAMGLADVLRVLLSRGHPPPGTVMDYWNVTRLAVLCVSTALLHVTTM